MDFDRDLLDLPFRHDRRRIDRFMAGLALDPPLRRLGRISGEVDRALALRLSKLRLLRGYVRLGYARFADYVRERLGIAERTAQELARLGRALERLPMLDAALRDGRLTWTAALQVARVATPVDEADWVAVASRLPVRDLKARVRAALERRRSTPPPSDAPEDPRPEVDEPDPAERPVCYRLFVDARTARCWHAAIDLCRLVAGCELPEHEAAEYLLADFLSGAGPGGRCGAEGHASGSEGRSADEGHGSNDEAGGQSPASPFRAHPHSPRGTGESHRPCADIPADLGSHEVDLPPGTLALLRTIDAPVPSDPFELDTSMRLLLAGRRGLDLDLARLLRQFDSLDLCRHIGFPTFTEYVDARLSISPRKARFLVRLDRRLTLLSEVKQAVREGEIGMVAALAVSDVADPETTEAAWIEHARTVPVERLRREIEWARRNASYNGGSGSILPPVHGRLPSALDEVTGAARARAGALAARGRDADWSGWLRAGGWQTFAGLPEDDGSTECSARSPAGGWQTFAGPPEDNSPPDWSAWLRAEGWQTFAGPPEDQRRVQLDLRLSDEADRLWQTALWRLIERTSCYHANDGDVLRAVAFEFLITWMPLWLEAVTFEDPIAVRERFRCAIPGCTVHGGSAHHVRYRSRGGPDDDWNLSFICYTHHIEGIHRGHLRVHGRAPDHLTVELGIRPDGTALERFVDGRRFARPPGEDRQFPVVVVPVAFPVADLDSAVGPVAGPA